MVPMRGCDDMDVKILRNFLEVAATGSVTKAASNLGISQPTLSKQIKDLEAELGCKLFVRSSYSVRLTEEGMVLRRRAEDIVGMVDTAVEEIRSMDGGSGGDIRVGCAESEGIRHLARCFGELREQNPGMRLHLYSGNTEDLSARLEGGFLDFAVLAQEADLDRYEAIRFPCTDRWGIVMKDDSPLASKKSVTLDDLEGLPLICSRQGVEADLPAWLRERVDHVGVVATFNLAYNGGVMVREGLGYMLVFDGLVSTLPGSGLCFRPISPVVETPLYVVWKRGRTPSPAASMLLDMMREEFGSGDRGD